MDETDSVDIIIRPFNKEVDQAFIYSSWRNSYYDLLIDPQMPSNKYYRNKTKEIREILKTAAVRIACFKDDKNTIAGYAVSTKNAELPGYANLTFIYVKIELRNKGIGRLLFPKDTLTVGPEMTKVGQKIAEKKNLTILKGEKDGNTDKPKERAKTQNNLGRYLNDAARFR